MSSVGICLAGCEVVRTGKAHHLTMCLYVLIHLPPSDSFSSVLMIVMSAYYLQWFGKWCHFVEWASLPSSTSRHDSGYIILLISPFLLTEEANFEVPHYLLPPQLIPVIHLLLL